MAIISISGKIFSGKDTVGRIVQYLTWQKNSGNLTMSYHEWDKAVPNPCPKGEYQVWEIKKFAGKLKQICSLLTGIPVEDFEKSSVKDSLLPEEWFKYGIDGDHDFTPDDYGYVYTYEDAIELAYDLGEDIKFIQKYRMTVRDLLQQVGTNALRHVVHPNIWLNALFSDYKVKNYVPNKTYSELDLPNWIITDCRFPNEADISLQKDAVLIRVNRISEPQEDSRMCTECGAGFSLQLMDDNNGLSPCCKNHEHVSVLVKPSTHSSETALDNYKFEHIIDNNGTINELVEKVKEILIKTKVL